MSIKSDIILNLATSLQLTTIDKREKFMFNFIIKGGVVMIPIIFCSIIGLAIILEKFWSLYKLKLDCEKFANDVFLNIKQAKFDKALDLCKINSCHPLARLFRLGLENRDLAANELEKLLEHRGNVEVRELERYLGGLITIIGVEPLFGFLGTIAGLISAFMAWEKAGANISVSLLAAGIYQAMITTAAGLIVAIPYYLAYNYISSRIKYISHDLNDYSAQLLQVLLKVQRIT